MSYEPSAPPPLGAPAPAGPPPKRSHPGRTATILGIAAIVVGLVGGLALAVGGVAREQSAVENLARAPVGCSTRLEFDRTGTFYVYVETAGTIDDLGGSCPNDDREFETDDDRPNVRVELTDADGDEVDTDRASGTSYDTGGFVGRMTRTFEIDEAGDYVLLVTSDDDEVVVAVGGDVGSIATTWVAAGVALALVGLVAGVVLLIVGASRRRRARRTASSDVPAPGAFAAPMTYPPVTPTSAPSPMPPPPAPEPPPSAPSPGSWQPPSV